MSTRYLDKLFSPQSVVLIGATNSPGSIGGALTRLLVDGHFDGTLTLINPHHEILFGHPCFPYISGSTRTPDLALIAVPAQAVPEELAKLGIRGVKTAILFSDIQRAKRPLALQQEIHDTAQHFNIRIVGPNSNGINLPTLGLQGGLVPVAPLPGSLAFVSQGGGIISSVVDWSTVHGIGFSKMLALGDMVDVNYADVLNYLAEDENTSAILLYIDTIQAPRAFMSAARAAARAKPVVLVRGGVASDNNPLTDSVYDAAFQRAGILRASSLEGLFDAIQVLGGAPPVSGKKLGVVSNSIETAMLAEDALRSLGGELAKPDRDPLAESRALPLSRNRLTNPVILPPAALPIEYADAISKVRAKSDADAVLVLHSPNAVVDSQTIAQAVITEAKQDDNIRVFTCWLGEQSVLQSRYLFNHNGIPNFVSPDKAIQGYYHVTQHRKTQALLLETPTAKAPDTVNQTAQTRSLVEAYLQEQHLKLGSSAAMEILSLYSIPIVPEQLAKTPADAAKIAESLDGPIALKIQSADIPDKSSVGGVVLNLHGYDTVLQTAAAMRVRVGERFPDATLEGFLVQPMRLMADAFELAIDIHEDPTFGPVICISSIDQESTTIALPPLNMTLALETLNRSWLKRHLRQELMRKAMATCLVQLSELIINIPEIKTLSISPLVVDQHGIAVVDARITLAEAPDPITAESRLAIRPYPDYLTQTFSVNGEEMTLRPVKPEDAEAFRYWFSTLPSQDIYTRFFHIFRDLSPMMAARLTQIDYDREMAFVLTRTDSQQQSRIVAEARLTIDGDKQFAQFALLLSPAIRGMGMGKRLIEVLREYALSRQIPTLYGDVLSTNRAMRSLGQSLGFTETIDSADNTVLRIEKDTAN